MTDRYGRLLFVMAQKIPAIHDRLYQLVPWVYRCDRRYFEILLTGYDTRTTLTRWLGRGDTEIARHQTRLLIANDKIAGGFCAMPAREVRPRREADILDLVRHHDNPRSPDLRARLKDLLPLFGPVSRRDFYISKFGLAPHMSDRSEELCEALIEECLDVARASGTQRVRIDIDETEQPLCKLLEEYDFKPIRKGKAPVSDINYLNLARDL